MNEAIRRPENPIPAALLNFLVANLFAVVPLLWLAFGWIPDRVKIELGAKSRHIPALVSGDVVLRGFERAGTDGGTLWKFYLKEGMEWDNLAFRLPEGMNERGVRRVCLEKWKLFALEKPVSELERKEGPGNDYVFRNPRSGKIRFAQGKTGWGLAGAELLLLGLSLWAAKRHRPERWKTLLPSVLGVSFALALLIQVALPVQSYVANRSAFPFGPWELAGAVAARFLLAFAATAACLGLLCRRFGRAALSMAFAFALCAYLESGILSEGLPSLKGDWTVYTDLSRGLKDAAVWGGVFAAVAALHRWLKPWLGVAGLCLAVMSAASMPDAKPEKKADTSHLIVHDFASVETVIRNATYSTHRNVMVFIVDSLEREQAHAIMEDPEAGPGLRERFRGFTEYTNNVGACEYSLPSVANMMTGGYPEAPMDPDFFASVYSEASVLKDYLEAGYAVCMGTSSLGYGYTNRRREEKPGAEEDRSVWSVHSRGNSEWGLTAFCRFRWLPFIAKEPYAVVYSAGRAVARDVASREKTAYPILMAGDVSADEKGAFLLLHTDGVHFPVVFNRHGEQLPTANNTGEGMVENGIFVLTQLGQLMDDYRAKGIFDESLIVVLADHGRHEDKEKWTGADGDTIEFSGNGRPFLWVKPPRCDHPFASSGAPTSHAKIAALLETALRKDPDDREIREILSSEDRVYRREMHGNWNDFHVGADNAWRVETVAPSEIENSRMRPIRLGQLIPLEFDVANISERGDIRYKGFPPRPEGGFFLGWKPCWSPLQKRVSMAFKVASGPAACRVRLVGTAWMLPEADGRAPGSALRFSARGGETVSVKEGTEGVVEIVLDGVEPDEDGIVEIVGDREDGCGVCIALTQLEVTETHGPN